MRPRFSDRGRAAGDLETSASACGFNEAAIQ